MCVLEGVWKASRDLKTDKEKERFPHLSPPLSSQPNLTSCPNGGSSSGPESCHICITIFCSFSLDSSSSLVPPFSVACSMKPWSTSLRTLLATDKVRINEFEDLNPNAGFAPMSSFGVVSVLFIAPEGRGNVSQVRSIRCFIALFFFLLLLFVCPFVLSLFLSQIEQVYIKHTQDPPFPSHVHIHFPRASTKQKISSLFHIL